MKKPRTAKKPVPPLMSAETLAALWQSISKWRLVAEGGEPYNVGSSHDCPLCLIFHPEFGGNPGCRGCPVREATGEPFCRGTYVGAFNRAASHDVRLAAAKAEYKFLRSLVPEGEKG